MATRQILSKDEEKVMREWLSRNANRMAATSATAAQVAEKLKAATGIGVCQNRLRSEGRSMGLMWPGRKHSYSPNHKRVDVVAIAQHLEKLQEKADQHTKLLAAISVGVHVAFERLDNLETLALSAIEDIEKLEVRATKNRDNGEVALMTLESLENDFTTLALAVSDGFSATGVNGKVKEKVEALLPM
jgi:hypothetical protein